MKTRNGRTRLSLLKMCSLGLAAASLASIAFAAAAPAPTPVDLYQDMESGKAGDLLTPELVTGSCHGEGGTWSLHGDLWVSTENAKALPGPVTVGEKSFTGSEAPRTWMFKDSTTHNYVQCNFKDRNLASITVACFYTPGVTIPFGNQFDTIALTGARAFAVMQTRNDDGKGPYLRAHSCTTGWKTTFSPTQIKIVSGKTYWVNLHFDGKEGKAYVAAFDPEKGFAQVGETVVAESCPTPMWALAFGRFDNHGNNPKATTQSYFGQILVDYTKGAFPLLPQAAPPAGSTDTAPAQTQDTKNAP